VTKFPDEAWDCRKCAFFPGDGDKNGKWLFNASLNCKWFFYVDFKCWTPVGCAMITDEELE